jgi:hypothetical protein
VKNLLIAESALRTRSPRHFLGVASHSVTPLSNSVSLPEPQLIMTRPPGLAPPHCTTSGIHGFLKTMVGAGSTFISMFRYYSFLFRIVYNVRNHHATLRDAISEVTKNDPALVGPDNLNKTITNCTENLCLVLLVFHLL